MDSVAEICVAFLAANPQSGWMHCSGTNSLVVKVFSVLARIFSRPDPEDAIADPTQAARISPLCNP
jgi:hypothetical protein